MGGPDAMDLSGFPAIETAAGLNASYSMLVIPGAEGHITNGDTPHRSGLPEPSQEMQTSLARLMQSHSEQALDMEEAYALIAGKLAAGDYRIANDLVVDAERRFGEQADFSAARGIALFHLDQLPEAEGAFRDAIKRDPDRPVYWYDLAVVLKELGDIDESRRFARNVIDVSGGTPLAQRAQSLLSSI